MSDAEGGDDHDTDDGDDGDGGDATVLSPSDVGSADGEPSRARRSPLDRRSNDAPPVEEKPYKIVFEANRCFGAGKCAEVADNWELDLATGMARPRSYFVAERDLEENVRAAEVCPAKKGAGCIHVVDRRTDEEIAPDPHGDGTLSVDW